MLKPRPVAADTHRTQSPRALLAPTLRQDSLLAQLGPGPRIAVLRTGRLGDLLVLTPALRCLKAAVPAAQITLLVNERALPLARRLRCVDDVVEVPDLLSMQRLGRGEPDLSMREVLEVLRSRRFDLVLQCAGGGETTNGFVRALSAGFTAGQQWPDAPPLDLWMPYQRNQADVLRLMDIMELVGTPRGPLEYDVEVTAEDAAALDHAYAFPPDKDLVGVAVGAGSGARCWPTDRFATLTESVMTKHPEVIVVLTGTQDERRLTRDVLQRLPDAHRVVDLAGQLSFGALIALIARLRLFIGNDSAPAHLANALEIPSVVIFGSAHPAQWAPTSRVLHRVIADETAPCRRFVPPCGCPDDARALCISAIDVAEVETQVEAVVALVSTGSTQGASHERSTTVVGKSW